MNVLFEKLENELISLFANNIDVGHDLNHAKRVLNNALTIQKEEGGDEFVISTASLFHDVHRIIETKTGCFCSPKNSLIYIKEILDRYILEKDKVDRILHCIEFHEEYNFSKKGKKVNDIETLILQDADNLDAIGAIGIARTFSFGARNHIPMWLPDKNNREFFEESICDVSTIDHFYNKLLKLKDNMNTKTGRKIAKERHDFMKIFLEQFKKEWKIK